MRSVSLTKRPRSRADGRLTSLPQCDSDAAGLALDVMSLTSPGADLRGASTLSPGLVRPSTTSTFGSFGGGSPGGGSFRGGSPGPAFSPSASPVPSPSPFAAANLNRPSSVFGFEGAAKHKRYEASAKKS